MTPAYPKEMQIGRGTIDVQEFREYIEDEASLQRQAEAYLRIKGLFFIRIPDGIYKVVFGQSKLSARVKEFLASFVKGIPDLTILIRDGEKHNRALCLELKTKKGKLTHHQRHVAERINVVVCRSLEQVEKEVDEFLGGTQS